MMRISIRKIFLKVAALRGIPQSACPSPERYMKAYECDAEHIYAVTLSAEWSGSYNSAILGKNLFLEEQPEKRFMYLIPNLHPVVRV